MLRFGEINFLGLTNLDVNLKRMHQLFCYILLFSLTLFLFLYPVFFIFSLNCTTGENLFVFLKAFLFILTTGFRKDKKFFLDLNLQIKYIHEPHKRKSNCRKSTVDCSYKRRKINTPGRRRS